ncbi:MAG: endolytic transglycosylase MltG [bacterium]
MKFSVGQGRQVRIGRGAVTFVGLTLLILLAIHIYGALTTPLYLDDPEGKIIEIKRGMNISEISLLLKKEKVIRDVWLFKLLTRVKYGMVIKAGEYRMNSTINILQLLDMLEHGKALCHKVTVPEGRTIRQIAEILAERGMADAEKFIETANDPALARQLGIQAESLEGYLFPDTYCFTKGLPEKLIIEAMVLRFHQVIPREWEERAREIGFDFHQIVTLASLIEKETSCKEEKPLVSAAYHNRLRDGMRLQCDPTVIYSLASFGGTLTKEHLSIDSPYNTYRIYGLPPGPIANPGKDSIWAALHPLNIGYRYFVSKNNGTHQFSFTLEEHNRAVEKYQRRR